MYVVYFQNLILCQLNYQTLTYLQLLKRTKLQSELIYIAMCFLVQPSILLRLRIYFKQNIRRARSFLLPPGNNCSTFLK